LVSGPFAGAIHDMSMLDSSDIVSELDGILDCEDIDDKFYALPFLTGLALTDNQCTTNEMMSSVRECVEWEFGHVVTLFAFVGYRPGQKVFLIRVGMFYVVSTSVHNEDRNSRASFDRVPVEARSNAFFCSSSSLEVS
ncbi:hypothetical protein INT47_002658, partial [Mucor saturninus]